MQKAKELTIKEDGHWTTGLLWKSEVPLIEETNYERASAIKCSEEKKLNPTKLEQVNQSTPQPKSTEPYFHASIAEQSIWNCEMAWPQNTSLRYCTEWYPEGDILSNCVRAFKATSRELKSLLKNFNWSQIEECTSKPRTSWIFSSEKALWHSAIAERMIRSVEESLRKVSVTLLHGIGDSNDRDKRDSEQQTTRLCQWHSLRDLVPIVLAELCIGHPIDVLPSTPGQYQELSHTYWCRTGLLNQFWRTWTNTYLLDQQLMKIWHSSKNMDLKIGKVLLLREDNLNQGEGEMGRVEEILHGWDRFG